MRFREWQSKAYEAYSNYHDTGYGFLVSAFPGAGKTLFACGTFAKQHALGVFEKMIIIVSSDNLRQQWAESAFKIGINLLPVTEQAQNPFGFDGMVLTYHQLDNYYAKITHYSTLNKVMAVFDEIHHAGEEATWGASLQKAFKNTYRQLLLSGSPFRSDEQRIPFVRYDENNEATPNYSYRYRDAIEDGVCRPAVFISKKGAFAWMTNKFSIDYGTLGVYNPNSKMDRILGIAIQDNGFIDEMLREGLNKLSRCRKEEPNAGCLITAKDKAHASLINKRLEAITGARAKIVTSDDVRANEKIEHFRGSRERFIIAVKMISEGVDIPRLRVCVNLSNIKTRMFFIQLLGRIIRGQGLSYFIMPADPRLMDYAKEIEDDHLHKAAKKEEQEDLFTPKAVEEKDTTGGEQYLVFDSKFIGEEIIFHGERVPSEGDGTIGQIEIPIYRYLGDLRDEINKAVITLAKLTAATPKIVHSRWIALGRPETANSTARDLRDKMNWVAGQLAAAKSRNIYKPKKKGRVF